MKEFTFKTLTSDQLFNFCEVLDAIGIDAFTDIFSKENLAEFKDSEDTEKAGMAIGMKILKVLVKNLPKAKNQIHVFVPDFWKETWLNFSRNVFSVDRNFSPCVDDDTRIASCGNGFDRYFWCIRILMFYQICADLLCVYKIFCFFNVLPVFCKN